jgi:hypothetical protein
MASTKQPDIVAIHDIGDATAGAIVWWRLRGNTDLRRLTMAWDKAGHDPKLLPSKTTPLAALKRALADLGRDARQLVRPLAKKEGYALVNETAHGDDLTYDTICTVKVMPGDVLDIMPSYFSSADRLIDGYEKNQSEITGSKIGGWLGDMVRHCHAVALRWTGGIYFIPAEHMDKFHTWMEAFMDGSDNTVFEVPALRSSEAVEAILDAVEREAGEELAAIEEEIATGDLGANALKTREKRCDELRNKLQSYVGLLGSRLDGINDKLDVTKASVVETILLAEEAD